MKKDMNNIRDKHLWSRVTRTVSPLRDKSSKPEKSLFVNMLEAPIQTEKRGVKTQRPLSARQDKKTRRGNVDYDRKLDLHDLTQAEAFSSLRRTIIRSFNQNHKCVLVVTGKGIRGQGILRRSLPNWLEHPDIRPVISEYAQAHLRHGGSGAWYVFLKSGK